MASIGTNPNGRRRILFVDADGSRKTVRLGKATAKAAQYARVMIELLLESKRTGRKHVDAEEWCTRIDSKLRHRLERVGLISHEPMRDSSVSDVLTEYFANLEVGPRTLKTYEQTRKSLETYFQPSQPARSIGPLDAERWKQASLAAGLAPSTVAKRVRQARTIFRHAVRWKMIDSNPFAEVKGGGMTNRSRMFFVTREMADSVIDSCPDTEWKLIFALSRYGGLRCPSEHCLLRWEDIDWSHSRMLIRSPKTERHGGDHRFVPIFPELRPLLLKAFEEAAEGAKFVLPRVSSGAINLRTRMIKIVRRAGLTPWPKLMHNLRSSRQTELARTHPAHVVCSWLGNSPAVAAAHYLQVTEDDFEKAAQIPAQHSPVRPSTGRKSTAVETENSEVFPHDSMACRCVRHDELTPRGVEPLFAG